MKFHLKSDLNRIVLNSGQKYKISNWLSTSESFINGWKKPRIYTYICMCVHVFKEVTLWVSVIDNETLQILMQKREPFQMTWLQALSPWCSGVSWSCNHALTRHLSTWGSRNILQSNYGDTRYSAAPFSFYYSKDYPFLGSLARSIFNLLAIRSELSVRVIFDVAVSQSPGLFLDFLCWSPDIRKWHIF